MKKAKYIFGYQGASEYYWLYATSYSNMIKQINQKGMEKPDWYEKL